MKDDVESGNEEVCSICLDPTSSSDQRRRLPCGHEFHSSCLDEWLERKAFCPVCRRDAEGGVETESSSGVVPAPSEEGSENTRTWTLAWVIHYILSASNSIPYIMLDQPQFAVWLLLSFLFPPLLSLLIGSYIFFFSIVEMTPFHPLVVILFGLNFLVLSYLSRVTPRNNLLSNRIQEIVLVC